MLLLAYTSRSSFDFTDGDLITVLMTSRLNNRRLGLTGILLHDDGRFVQVLEGEDQVVRDRFTLIERDPRHSEVEVLLEEHAAERQFPKWTMGYKTLSDPLVRDIPGYDSFFTRAPGSGETPVRALLERFRSDPGLADSVESD